MSIKHMSHGVKEEMKQGWFTPLPHYGITLNTLVLNGLSLRSLLGMERMAMRICWLLNVKERKLLHLSTTLPLFLTRLMWCNASGAIPSADMVSGLKLNAIVILSLHHLSICSAVHPLSNEGCWCHSHHRNGQKKCNLWSCYHVNALIQITGVSRLLWKC